MIVEMLTSRRGRGADTPQSTDYIKGESYAVPGQMPADIAKIYLAAGYARDTESGSEKLKSEAENKLKKSPATKRKYNRKKG